MTRDELMAEAGRLAEESVVKGWGGPFGAVVAQAGICLATGQSRVLSSGDPTAHAEMEAIRRAIQALRAQSPGDRPGAVDRAQPLPAMGGGATCPPERLRMLAGCEIYSSGEPCPMCMGAMYWARLESSYKPFGIEATRELGFDDAVFYDELGKRPGSRRLTMVQLRSPICDDAYARWLDKPDRRLY